MARTGPYNDNMLGRRIEERLDELGWTQAQLAEGVEVYQQTVSKWIKGETTPRPQRLRRIEGVLKMGDGDLLAIAFPDKPRQGGDPLTRTATRVSRVTALERRLSALEAKVDELLARLRPSDEAQ